MCLNEIGLCAQIMINHLSRLNSQRNYRDLHGHYVCEHENLHCTPVTKIWLWPRFGSANDLLLLRVSYPMRMWASWKSNHLRPFYLIQNCRLPYSKVSQGHLFCSRNVSRNQFSGIVSMSIFNSSSIMNFTKLDFSHNNFSGPLPDFGSWSGLQALWAPTSLTAHLLFPLCSLLYIATFLWFIHLLANGILDIRKNHTLKHCTIMYYKSLKFCNILQYMGVVTSHNIIRIHYSSSGLIVFGGIFPHWIWKWEYSVDYCQSHITLLWIWIMSCGVKVDGLCHIWKLFLSFFLMSSDWAHLRKEAKVCKQRGSFSHTSSISNTW